MSPATKTEVSDSDKILELQHAIQTSQSVLRKIRNKIDTKDRELVDSALANSSNISNQQGSKPFSPYRYSSLSASHADERRTSGSNKRYLGEVSDVSFFNTIRHRLQHNIDGADEVSQLESYDQENLQTFTDAHSENPTQCPDYKSADKYVEIFFSTVHIAYPFICRQRFQRQYQEWWTETQTPEDSYGFESLLCES